MVDQRGPEPPEEPMDLAYTWPLVLLTDLDKSSQDNISSYVQSMLQDDLQTYYNHYFVGKLKADARFSSNVKIWLPSEWLLKSISLQGPHWDSLSNIHALAVLAFRSGRPRIIVADETTKRHLAKDRDPKCDPMVAISVILVSTKRLHRSERISVFVKRALCHSVPVNAENPSLSYPQPDPQIPDFQSVVREWGPLWIRENEGHAGFIVHDPDQPLLKSGSGQILEKEYYVKAVTAALCPDLPLEITFNVSHTRSSEIKMPVWNRRPSYEHLVIFLLYHTTTKERRYTRRAIEDAHPTMFLPLGGPPKMTLELVPWDRHQIRSRRDLMTFWERYRLWDAQVGGLRHAIMPLIYLDQPLEDPKLALFGALHGRGVSQPVPAVMTRMELHIICDYIASTGYITAPLPGDHEYEVRPDVPREFLWNPDQPCFSKQLLLTTSWYCPRLMIFLTNWLTKEDMERLRNIMLVHDRSDPSDTNGYLPIEYRVLPWRDGDTGVTSEAGVTDEAEITDGKLEYIWDTVSKLYIEPCSWLNRDAFFCVDEQFAIDQTVILGSVEEYVTDPAHNLLEHLPFPFVKGFLFRRIPVKRAVSCGNKRKVAGEWLRYSRPGWPSPGLLPGDS